jgi:hypothetical protein
LVQRRPFELRLGLLHNQAAFRTEIVFAHGRTCGLDDLFIGGNETQNKACIGDCVDRPTLMSSSDGIS